MYDWADKKSFTAIPKMVHKVSEHVQGKKSILIANANGDPKATRAITEQEGRQKAEEL